MLDFIFDDKRVAALLLSIWMVAVVGLLQTIDLLHSEFMSFGPSSHMRFMSLTIDTWGKWWLLAIATFTSTCVSDFMSDAIVPWIQNTLQDHKTQYLPYSKVTCYLISQVWGVYCTVMLIFSVALMTSQIDLLLLRMGTDLLVSSYTTFKFMRTKLVDRVKYMKWSDEEAALQTSI